MLSKSRPLLPQFLRQLRTLRKRTVPQESFKIIESNSVPTLKNLENERPVLPLEESDLQNLNKGNFESETHCNSSGSQVYNLETLMSSRPQKTFKKKSLTDYKLEVPLTEPATSENEFERLSQSVTPLYKLPYYKQLELKQDYAERMLLSLKKELRKYKTPLCPSINRLPCPLEKIYPSPDIIRYRNKDEFSVNIGVNGNPKTVGYYVGVPKDPLMRCVNPTHLINIRDNHKLICQHFQNFIRDSHHKTCLNFNEGGVWRTITARSTLAGEQMLCVKIYPKDLKEGDKEEIKEDLKSYFFHGDGAECKLSSLYLQACPHTRCTRETAPYELIEGKEFIIEECLGRQFQISPDSFFQTNTKAAELMYEVVEKVSEASNMTTILDICCGTGTISNLMAHKVRGAIGIDVITGAIEDAKMNAIRNDITNVNFIPGKVEKMLPILTEELKDCTEVIAIMNPARAGLSPTVIEAIRGCQSIKKLIYVCCKLDGNTGGNMALLGSTLQWKKMMPSKTKLFDPGFPFVPTYCIPIDIFPHTLHSEYVMLFERVEITD